MTPAAWEGFAVLAGVLLGWFGAWAMFRWHGYDRGWNAGYREGRNYRDAFSDEPNAVWSSTTTTETYAPKAPTEGDKK